MKYYNKLIIWEKNVEENNYKLKKNLRKDHIFLKSFVNQ